MYDLQSHDRLSLGLLFSSTYVQAPLLYSRAELPLPSLDPALEFRRFPFYTVIMPFKPPCSKWAVQTLSTVNSDLFPFMERTARAWAVYRSQNRYYLGISQQKYGRTSVVNILSLWTSSRCSLQNFSQIKLIMPGSSKLSTKLNQYIHSYGSKSPPRRHMRIASICWIYQMLHFWLLASCHGSKCRL